jgi:hypothetical protein
LAEWRPASKAALHKIGNDLEQKSQPHKEEPEGRCCQTKANWCPKTVMPPPSGRKLPPLSHSSSAVELEGALASPIGNQRPVRIPQVHEKISRRDFAFWFLGIHGEYLCTLHMVSGGPNTNGRQGRIRR